jgi:transcriptional regulator with XRE-family HTH domain
MLSSGQIRAARALLRWTADDLAKESVIGVATIRRLELQDGVPKTNTNTLVLIKKTLERVGIEFIGDPDNSPGVRLNIK